MKKHYEFSAGKWEKEDFFYVYSPRWGTRMEFLQEENFVTNNYNDGKMHYISILTKEKYPVGTKLRTKCNFQSFGAPLVVISDDIRTMENGELQYGVHFEVVAWYKGVNIWRVEPYPERKSMPIHSNLIAKKEFKIEDESVIEIELEIGNKEIIASVNGEKISVSHEDIPENCHVGITACEGFNRFYDFEIEE